MGDAGWGPGRSVAGVITTLGVRFVLLALLALLVLGGCADAGSSDAARRAPETTAAATIVPAASTASPAPAPTSTTIVVEDPSRFIGDCLALRGFPVEVDGNGVTYDGPNGRPPAEAVRDCDDELHLARNGRPPPTPEEQEANLQDFVAAFVPCMEAKGFHPRSAEPQEGTTLVGGIQFDYEPGEEDAPSFRDAEQVCLVTSQRS